MNSTSNTELMHAVLDGEADESQAQALKRLLAADPAARAEFEALKQLFSELDGVPQRHPPEGLFAGVMAAVEARQSSRRSQRPQLSFLSRVFGPTPRDTVSRTSNLSKPFNWSMDMSKQTSSPYGNRKFWIGGATAAAALLVWQFGFNSWPVEKDVMGTIAPAERYRAPQATAGDIKVGAPSGGGQAADPLTQPGSTQAGNAAGATGNAAGATGNAAGATGNAAGATGNAAGATGNAAGATGNAAGATGNAAGATGNAAGATGNAAGATGNAAGATGNAAAAAGNAAMATGNAAAATGK
jgi:hypothetical protein